MVSDDISPEATATAEFERELTDLIVSAFARGIAIERTWEITVPVSAAPNWSVEVTKTYSDGDATYDPELIDE